jgi:hypothetical protein
MRIFTVFFALFLITTPRAFAGEPVAQATDVKGDVTVMHAGAATGDALKTGDPLFGLDIVTTGADGHASIHFTDESDLVLSGKGKLLVQEYLYDAQHPANNKMHLSILGAAFSYLGGLIEKREQPDAVLTLDNGSIGIRGTKILGALADSADWVYLDAGKIIFTNDAGEAILSPGEGTQVPDKTQAPKTPYKFSPEEVAFLQKIIDDPTALNASLASNAMPLGRGQASQVAAAETARQMAPPSEAGGGAAFDKEVAREEADTKAKAPAAAAASAPAAPPVMMNSMPADTGEAATGSVTARARSPVEVEPKALAGKNGKKRTELFTWDGMVSVGLKVTAEKDGSVRIESDKPQTVTIGKIDLSKMHIDDTLMHFSAQMKGKGLAHPAYLQLLLHLPGPKGGNTYFSNGLAHPLMNDGDWETFSTPFTLKKGETPDAATLNIVMTGAGAVWIKDVHLTRD